MFYKGWVPILAFWGILYYVDFWGWAVNTLDTGAGGFWLGFMGFIGIFYTFVWIGRAS